jgi:hypothetical protein
MLANKPDPNHDDLEIWRDLARYARRTDGGDDILDAARLFAAGKPKLEEYLAGRSSEAPAY